jgi:serine/threonine protein kinase
VSVLDYARVRDAFDACVGVEAAQRGAALAALSLNPEERAEVDSLLAAHDADAAHDEVSNRISAAAANSITALERPARLGPWRITGEIGEGGMGVVLAAVRDDGEYDQTVAIKVIRGFSSAAARETLRRERQILASLEHPNIARLLDGGSTPGGEPYLVLEFVDGEPLGVWMTRAQPMRARIELFAAICRAVAFAHQRLVMHRDLKPANVLVRRNGSPVLLDFGIAKLVEADDTARDGTRTHAMTSAYASPERLRGESVTTASDVFGLGLLLFVLLGGDVRQRQDPLRAASTTVDSASTAARNSEHATVRAFAPQLRGDLDAIVRQATRLDSARRCELGSVLQDLGRLPEAEAAYLRALDSSRQIEGDTLSARTASMINNLATLREERGDLARAEEGYRESLAIRLRTLNSADLGIARAQGNLARALIARGHLDEAGQLLELASASRRAVLPAGHPELLASDAMRLEWQLARGDLDAAGVSAKGLRAALASAATLPAARSHARILAVLARQARSSGDVTSAIALFESALEKLATALPDKHPAIAQLRIDLAETLQASDPSRARQLRAQAQPVLDAVLVAEAPIRARFRDD